MSEERKMILQMVADGKISAEEADQLLQAIEETERAARQAAGGGQPHGVEDLAHSVERVVEGSLRGLDDALRNLEGKLDDKLSRQYGHDPGRDIRSHVQEKVRRAAEKAVEEANRAAERAQERAQRIAEREAERAQRNAEREAERAERMAERQRERAERGGSTFAGIGFVGGGSSKGPTFFKYGVSIDQVTHEESHTLTEAWQSGDRLVIENRVGDVDVLFYHGDQVEVVAHKTVWGEDQADAERMAAATKVALQRKGSDLLVEVTRPTVVALLGIMHIKDTRINYAVRVPHGTNLELRTKVGDLRIYSKEQVGLWNLETKVGDVEAAVAPEAGFRYQLRSTIGEVTVDLGADSQRGSTSASGRLGDGTGQINAITKTGDIRLHH